MRIFQRHIPLLAVLWIVFSLLLATLPLHDVTPADSPQLSESHIYCPICLAHYQYEPDGDPLPLVFRFTSEIVVASSEGLPPISFLFENNNRAPPEHV